MQLLLAILENFGAHPLAKPENLSHLTARSVRAVSLNIYEELKAS